MFLIIWQCMDIGERIDNMYRIDKAGCPKGWAYVVDYMGNRCYYGSIKDCEEFIRRMENE